tara:strand:- start:3065 stop:4066 length:1002 start_codon:yes stop_codon:yes gene_type:complete
MIKLADISLNYYSFGYSAKLIKNENSNFKEISLEQVSNISKKYNLAGIEFPIDRFFGMSNLESAKDFINKEISNQNKIFIDFESLDVAYIKSAISNLKSTGLKYYRIKMNHLEKVFYGGNRYKINNFDEYIVNFKNEMKLLLPTLKEYDVILLIENHQDLHSIELVNLIEEISPEFFGINWDIGNSFAVCDTPVSFFENAKHLIKNIHLKDYRVAKSLNGVKLVRCPIGSGDVNYDSLFKKYGQEIKKISSFSFELGAQISRNCDILLDDYWIPYKKMNINREYFTDYMLNTSGDIEIMSDLENNISGLELRQKELNDVKTTVNNFIRILSEK